MITKRDRIAPVPRGYNLAGGLDRAIGALLADDRVGLAGGEVHRGVHLVGRLTDPHAQMILNLDEADAVMQRLPARREAARRRVAAMRLDRAIRVHITLADVESREGLAHRDVHHGVTRDGGLGEAGLGRSQTRVIEVARVFQLGRFEALARDEVSLRLVTLECVFHLLSFSFS